MTLAQKNHVIQLPSTTNGTRPIEPREIAQQWLTNLETRLTSSEPSNLADLFHADSWWRDMVALEWDIRTIQGLHGIQEFIRRRQPRAQLSGFRLQHEGKFQPKLEKPLDSLSWISSMFFFNTRVGRGSGVLRLTRDETGEWKAYSAYTSLQELRDFPEALGGRRAEGTVESMPGGLSRGNWTERRERQIRFEDEEPTTLIVGAGMSIRLS